MEAGGLISYGINLVANWDRIVALVDKILKGEQVANIPVEFPTKIELLINLKTAKALGLHIDDLNLLRCTKSLADLIGYGPRLAGGPATGIHRIDEWRCGMSPKRLRKNFTMWSFSKRHPTKPQ